MLRHRFTDIIDDLFKYKKGERHYYAYVGTRLVYKRAFNSTCSVGYNKKHRKLQFNYCEEWLDGLSVENHRFVFLHEMMHIILGHLKRAEVGYNQKLANIAMDMIINSWLLEHEVEAGFIEPLVNEDGILKGCYLPADYKGGKTWEEVYEWLKQMKDQQDNEEKENGGEGGDGDSGGESQDGGSDSEGDEDSDGDGDGEERPGKGGESQSKSKPKSTVPVQGSNTLEGISPEELVRHSDEHEDETLDGLGDMDPADLERLKDEAEGVVRECKNKGIQTAGIESMIKELTKVRNNPLHKLDFLLKESMVGGKRKKSWLKKNTRSPLIRGSRPSSKRLNVLLDISGSMYGDIDRVLSYIYDKEFVSTVVLCDTEIKEVYDIKSMAELKKIKLVGFGGTLLQPGIDYAEQHLDSDLPLVILTDGYCDSLTLRNTRYAIVISCGIGVNIRSTGIVKHVMIEKAKQY